MNSNFTKALDMLLSMFYLQKYKKKRSDRFLTENELCEFVQTIYDYTFYCFSKADQEAMEARNKRPTLTLIQGGKANHDAMNKLMNKGLDEPYSDADVELIQQTLTQGGKADDDTIN